MYIHTFKNYIIHIWLYTNVYSYITYIYLYLYMYVLMHIHMHLHYRVHDADWGFVVSLFGIRHYESEIFVYTRRICLPENYKIEQSLIVCL